ncbi:Crp/Fnr family transcriptional regulator [Sphingobium aromaticiconvertens]|uniref:Crp/Fnr family transcriptional regulator n=1 Tax=Sphingobium aromaticiconvertens TaxID=365341 RepID=UPI00301A1866
MIFTDFLRGRRRHELTADDLAALEAVANDVRTLPARQTFIRQHEPVHFSTYLIEGLMCRYMDDREGLRQLVALHVTGDFVDLHGYPLRYLDHDLATITPCQIVTVPHERLDQLMENRPHLAKLLWFSTLMDAAIHREWIFALGRLDAVGRVAHFFCETEAKLRAVGLSDGRRFALPITQADLGEACGITSVHMNRMLRDLREDGILRFWGGKAEILDRARLERRAEFDPAYLYLDRLPVDSERA